MSHPWAWAALAIAVLAGALLALVIARWLAAWRGSWRARRRAARAGAGEQAAAVLLERAGFRILAEQPRTAYELAQAMWGNIAVTQAYLTLSEVLGHVDLLLADGSVHEERAEDGVIRFVSG